MSERSRVVQDQEQVEHVDDGGDVLECALAQISPFGLYRGYTLVLLSIPSVLAAMYSLSYVFVADIVLYRCVIPECEGVNIQFDNPTVVSLLPPDDLCRRYVPIVEGAGCERQHYHYNETIACETLVYQNTHTIFAEFDLGCRREWVRTLVGTVRNAALPFSLFITGYTSDSFGRRTAFCIFSACAGVLGIIKAFSINYQMYLALEFFEAALGYGFTSAAYVLLLELAPVSLRATFACVTGVAYGVGGMILAGVARGVLYWRHLLLAAYAPALVLPLYRVLVDESPRWLHAKGQYKRTENIIRKAAAWDKVVLDERVMSHLSEGGKVTREGGAEAEVSVWRAAVRSRVLLVRLGVCGWCWAATAFVYYGLTINSVTLAGNKYVNFALNMAMEVVASLLIMMALERIGRKLCIVVAFLLCGVACVSPFFVSHSGTSLGLYFLGKLSITFSFNSLYVFTAELYPTGTRTSALAACSLIGRIGSVLAPQTPLLEVRVQAALYGACSCLAALSVLFVPETRSTHLPQQVHDAELLRVTTNTIII